MKSLYLIGSLRNPAVPLLGEWLRKSGPFDVFDQWWTASDDADDTWKKYCEIRGLSYREALKDYAARHVFDFDKFHLDRCELGVLYMPAGKSGWAEMGYLTGQGKPVFTLFDGPPELERWDVMMFSRDVFFDRDELLKALLREVV